MQAEPTYSFLEDEPISKDLECPICLDPLLDPFEHVNCNNMFCHKCIETLQSCPLCEKTMCLFDNTKVVTVNYITNILNDIKVKCSQCLIIVYRKDFEKHVTQCAKCCPLGCNNMIAPIELDNHKIICPFRIVDCSEKEYGCLWKGEFFMFHEHKEKCEYVKANPILTKYLESTVYNYSDYDDIGPFPSSDELHGNYYNYFGKRNLNKICDEISSKLLPNEKFIRRIFCNYSSEGSTSQYHREMISISNFGTVVRFLIMVPGQRTVFTPGQEDLHGLKIIYLNKKIPISYFHSLNLLRCKEKYSESVIFFPQLLCINGRPRAPFTIYDNIVDSLKLI